MGKRLISQRRGRGTTTYRAPSHRYKSKLNFNMGPNSNTGTVTKIYHDPARSAPTAEIKFNDNKIIDIPASLGIKINQSISYNKLNSANSGDISKLENIPEGTLIYCIEKTPGSGPTFCRSAGNSARILAKTSEGILVELPSKKKHLFNARCRAVIGTIAGGGRKEKPLVKAGKAYHIMKAKNKLYPRVSGVAMNAVDHPFGSGRGRHIGKSKVAPRNAPPGRNVGLIRARRTGRKR